MYYSNLDQAETDISGDRDILGVSGLAIVTQAYEYLFSVTDLAHISAISWERLQGSGSAYGSPL